VFLTDCKQALDWLFVDKFFLIFSILQYIGSDGRADPDTCADTTSDSDADFDTVVDDVNNDPLKIRISPP
jgi:hypothetical protein